MSKVPSPRSKVGANRFVLRTSYFVLVLVAISGCVQTVQKADKPAAKSSLSPEAVKLTKADAKALNEMIASHKGQVVFVDYWAMWCLPCVANFPHTVELAHKYRDKGLVTIAVNFDLLQEEPQVRDFLAKQGAGFENLISSHDAIGQKPAEDFGIEPLPEYRLYDREGKLSKKWTGASEIDQIEKQIEELLGK